MQIKLYKTHSESNRIDKVLTDELERVGNLTDSCDIINPIITFSIDSNIILSNYAYIPAFNRYYYITDYEVTNKNITVYMHVDVLKSFATDVKNARGLIRRSNQGNVYLKDNLAETLAQNKYVIRNLGTGLSAGTTYVMIKGK